MNLAVSEPFLSVPVPQPWARPASRWVILLLFFVYLPSLSRAEPQPVDSAKGEINGIAAMAIAPFEYEGKRATQELSLSGCEVHLVSITDRNRETVHPCSTWFLEEKGTYDYWVEAPGFMSPFASRVVYFRNPFEGRGMAGGTAVGPAGRVLLRHGQPVASRHQLRLLHAGDHRIADMVQFALTRRAPAEELGEGLRMPAGPALAGLWDSSAKEYVALSRPFEVPGGDAVVRPALESPADPSSFLVVEIRRNRPSSKMANRPMEIALEQGDQTRSPDLQVVTVGRALAVWYDLSPGPAELHVRGKTEGIEALPVPLEPGSITRLEADLEPLPELTVVLDLPFALRHEHLRLDLLRPGGKKALHQAPVAADTEEVRFSRLFPGLYILALHTPLGTFRREVEVLEAEQVEVLAPELTTLSGTVYRGEEPHGATLAFTTTTQETLETEAGTDGAYEIVLLDPARSVSIRLAGSPFPPYVEYFSKTLSGNTNRDFEILDQGLAARVFDQSTGEGIAGARVLVRNTYLEPEVDQEMRVMQATESDEKGWALLPPVRPGTLELTASAPGYETQEEPVVGEIEKEMETTRFELPLEPSGPTTRVLVLTPTGLPAAGARVALFDSSSGGNLLAEAETDAEGMVLLPDRRAGAVALVRHPEAGALIRTWEPAPNTSWVLPSAAPEIVVQAVDRSREPVHQRLAVTLWIDDWRLSGLPLVWLFDHHPATDRRGRWHARNTPASARLAVLVTPWGPPPPPGVASLATRIPPAQARIEVPVTVL